MSSRKESSILKNLNWQAIVLFYVLVFIGWLSIYAAIYDPTVDQSIFDLDYRSGKQVLWMLVSMVIAGLILLIDYRFWLTVPLFIYVFAILLLVGVLLIGVEINGAKSWYQIGSFRLQPSEFAKVACALYLAKYLDDHKVKFGLNSNTVIIALIIFIPAILILLQNETGSVLVFASLIIVLYREGLNPLFPLLGIIFVFLFIGTFTIGVLYLSLGLFLFAAIAVFLLPKTKENILPVSAILLASLGVVHGSKFFVEKVLNKYQAERIYALFEPEKYAQGKGYQTMQSLKAIGHGGVSGTGHLKGDLTQLKQVPEQFTDFIFCTIGEEQGWLGTSILIIIYIVFLIQIILIAERQKAVFARVYGYSVASILFFHFTVNIGMTVGLFPVIGIPLPLISYGGSALWAFTILVFILLKFDMHRTQILARD